MNCPICEAPLWAEELRWERLQAPINADGTVDWDRVELQDAGEVQIMAACPECGARFPLLVEQPVPTDAYTWRVSLASEVPPVAGGG